MIFRIIGVRITWFQLYTNSIRFIKKASMTVQQ